MITLERWKTKFFAKWKRSCITLNTKNITIFSRQSYNAWTQFSPNTNLLMVTKSCIYKFDFIFYKLRFCLWLWLLWYLRHCLVPKVFSQNPHWRKIPSKWFASMWSLMLFTIPSFPQTLQMWAVFRLGVPSACFPDGIIFWLLSIIDFTFWSSPAKSPLNWLVMATAVGDSFTSTPLWT